MRLILNFVEVKIKLVVVRSLKFYILGYKLHNKYSQISAVFPKIIFYMDHLSVCGFFDFFFLKI